MKTSNMKQCAQKALTLCLLTVLTVTYSVVAFASTGKPVGELIITGKTSDGAAVTVNGEAAKSGRTIFSSSTISTPDGSGAVVSLGKLGRLELAPKTTFLLTADGDVLGGNLSSGSVTVLSAAQPVAVRTLTGEVVNLGAGDTAAATSTRAARDHRDSTGKCIDDDNDGELECGWRAIPWWGWAAIAGAVATVVIIAVVVSGDDEVESPRR